jgi:hypothetical protein
MRKLKVLKSNDELQNCLKLILAGLPVATGLPPTSAGSEASPAVKALPAIPQCDRPLLRMPYELQRAPKKPIEQRRWVMAIDLRKGIGCRFCMAARPHKAKSSNWHTYEKEQRGQNREVSLHPIIGQLSSGRNAGGKVSPAGLASPAGYGRSRC